MVLSIPKALAKLFASRSPRSACRCATHEPVHPPPGDPQNVDDDLGRGAGDPRLWGRPIGDFNGGQYSFAAVSGNPLCEDSGQVDITQGGLFVGIYDGHGGAAASRYALRNVVNNFMEGARACNGQINEKVLEEAVKKTENDFTAHAKQTGKDVPRILGAGSCCLIGVIWNGVLYIANMGDSRAVLGFYKKDKICDKQLTDDHNARRRKIRKELHDEHRGDGSIVIEVDGVWRVKGKIQVTRAIGDVYLKDPVYQVKDEPQYRLNHRFSKAVIRSDPEMFSIPITAKDKFLIFASDGLWEYLENDEAVEIVHRNRRRGSAKRLVIKALLNAARKRRQNYEMWRHLNNRRAIHDDITVVVVFLGNGENVPNLLIPQENNGESIIAFQEEMRFSEFGRFNVEGNPPGGGNDVEGNPPGGGNDEEGNPPGGGNDVEGHPPGGGNDVEGNPPGGNDVEGNPPGGGNDVEGNPPGGNDIEGNPPGGGNDEEGNPQGENDEEASTWSEGSSWSAGEEEVEEKRVIHVEKNTDSTGKGKGLMNGGG